MSAVTAEIASITTVKQERECAPVEFLGGNCCFYHSEKRIVNVRTYSVLYFLAFKKWSIALISFLT